MNGGVSTIWIVPLLMISPPTLILSKLPPNLKTVPASIVSVSMILWVEVPDEELRYQTVPLPEMTALSTSIS